MLKLVITFISLIGFSSFSQAEVDRSGSLVLSLTGVANDRISEVQGDQENNEINFGLGALIEAGINDHFGMETGVLLINRQYDVKEGNTRVVQEVKRLHIPILARFWATDFFSIAAGPFLSFRTGDAKTSLEIGGEDVGSISTSADDDVEYGLDAAVTFNIAIKDKSGIFVEGRYSAMLDNEQDEETNQVSALAGLKIDM